MTIRSFYYNQSNLKLLARLSLIFSRIMVEYFSDFIAIKNSISTFYNKDRKSFFKEYIDGHRRERYKRRNLTTLPESKIHIPKDVPTKVVKIPQWKADGVIAEKVT